MQIIERKEQINCKNVTVPVGAGHMKLEQGLLKGPCCARVFSHSCCWFYFVRCFLVGWMFCFC